MLAFAEYGNGPAVIFLHGLLGSKANMAGAARSLAAHRHTFVVDQRNHGDSFHHPSMTYKTMAADLGGLMDDHDIDNASVVGHSMGGKCAMQFAQSFPERVDRLVVVDIAPKRYADPDWTAYLQAMMRVDLKTLSSRKEAGGLLENAIPDQVYRQFLLSNLEKNGGTYRWKPDLDSIAAAKKALLADVEGPGCEAPTLFIRGGRSDYIAEKDHDRITQLFPNAEMLCVEEAGHLVHIEARERFNQILREFL